MKAEIEHFTRGESIAVEVGEIERALGALWQQASRTGETVAVSRATLWNVIIAARGRTALAATKQLVDEIAPALPTRTLTLCLDDAQRDGLEATIESNVVSLNASNSTRPFSPSLHVSSKFSIRGVGEIM